MGQTLESADGVGLSQLVEQTRVLIEAQRIEPAMPSLRPCRLRASEDRLADQTRSWASCV